MFSALVIVVYESLSCHQCEKMELKIIQSRHAEDAGKPKNLQDLEDLSEEHCRTGLLRANLGLTIKNNHKKVVDHQVMMHSIANQYIKLLNCFICMNADVIMSCGLYVM